MNKKHKLSQILVNACAITPKDKTRPVLNSIFLSKGVAYATNGFSLIAIDKAELKENEFEGLIPTESIKIADKGNIISLKEGEEGKGVLTLENSEMVFKKQEGSFPPLTIISETEAKTPAVKFCVSINYLKTLIDSISKIDSTDQVTISVSGATETILIRGTETTGILMPIRINN